MAITMDETPSSAHVNTPVATAFTGETLASVSGVTLTYPSASGDVAVLNDVSFDLNSGEIVSLTGPSGSGKSSLIAILGGLEPPTGGTVRVLDQDMTALSEAKRTLLRRRAIGIVFQSYHLVPAMTALQDVALPLMLEGEVDAEERAKALLEKVGLGHRIEHRPTALSGGEQQRVAVARAFVAQPRLVLADEPTGNLDQDTGTEVADLMFELSKASGSTMLLVTHDRTLAHRCDRMLNIDRGRVSDAG